MIGKPEFASNRENESVAAALNNLLGHVADTWAIDYEVCIATAYFNPGGFELLSERLSAVPHVRLLVGAEPQPGTGRVRDLDPDVPPQRAERARLRDGLTGHQRDLERDRDLLGFEVDADMSARRLIEWLRSGRVEVRRFEEGFLHGKAFIVTTASHGVVAGSSNFTYAGLAKNLELNLGQYQPYVVDRVQEWFEELWDVAVPYDLASVYDARYEPHSPHLVYLRMLYERYGREVEAEAAADGMGLHLASFQKDGVWRARRILDRYHGVLVADGVGLGKSFIAGELIRDAVQTRRQRVLVVAPAALRDGMWRKFLLKHQLGVEVVSFEQLTQDRRLSEKASGTSLQFGVNDYAMVVVDEAHGYRNPETDRAAVLRALLQGSPPKDLVMLSATPVNNTLWDLYYLLGLFIKNDAEFASAGIPALRAHFAEAMAADPGDLSPDRLFDILDAVAVRRTRHFVKRYYPSDTIDIEGMTVHLTFPQPVVRKVEYDLDAVLPGFFLRLAHSIDCQETECGRESHRDVWGEPVLTMARYNPSAYLYSEAAGERRAERAREAQIAGLLRSGLLKRFESSAHSFAMTCSRMAATHDAFLKLLDGGAVALGDTLTEWLNTDGDDVDEFLGSQDPSEVDDARLYRIDELRAAARSDMELLQRFAEEAEAVVPEDDPKLAALAKELAVIAAEASEEALGDEDERDKRKVIVFSYFADTANWVSRYLERVTRTNPLFTKYAGRLALVTGASGQRTEVLFGFAPKSTEAPAGSDNDLYDIIVTTDVLAEGVNLQQARHVINFDLPWNPQRLAQRHGRVDRLGSDHDRAYVRCFFPDRQLDALLGLEERLQRKIVQAAQTIGVESEILPGSLTSDQVFTETRDEIERLRNEDPFLFEAGGVRGHAYSGEEYRQELRQGLQDPDVARRVKSLPWGSGSGMSRMGSDSTGFVFCARVGNHAEPVFRYVRFSADSSVEVISDTLSALSHAHADVDTQRVLTEDVHLLAYDAWELAREDIQREWMNAADPANLQPQIPKAMRDAAQLLRDNPPPGYPVEQVDQIIDALEAPYGTRIQRIVRDAMSSSEDRRQAAIAVISTVADQGLRPPDPPKPLPVIVKEDVHLVCWQAITAG